MGSKVLIMQKMIRNDKLNLRRIIFCRSWRTLFSLLGCWFLLSQSGAWAQDVARRGPDWVDPRRNATVLAVEKVLPAVVNIRTQTMLTREDLYFDIWREFFDPYYRQNPQPRYSLGSGVIIHPEGYILTNNHVVAQSDIIGAKLSEDGREYLAKLIFANSETDVALLKIDRRPEDPPFVSVALAKNEDLLLGETVLALGNPFGLGGSVSEGILSSKNRRPPVNDQPLSIQDWLQTDAAINPGNSGGPLINLNGELIGLNVAVFREGQGIGFAIPIRMVAEALSEIVTPEKLAGLWFGARFRGGKNTLETLWVEPGSPADRGGLKIGDIVLEVDSKPVRDLFELTHALTPEGELKTHQLTLLRDAQVIEKNIRMIPESEVFNEELIRSVVGVTFKPNNDPEAGQWGWIGQSGFVITEVFADSPADRAGLSRGILVEKVDGQTPRNLIELAKLLHFRSPGKDLIMEGKARFRRRGLFGDVLETRPIRVNIPAPHQQHL